VAKRLRILSHLFTVAVKEWHWVSENPMKTFSMPKVANERTRFLSIEGGEHSELARLLQACRESESVHLYPVVLTTLITAARKGEVMGLTWADVDLDRGVVVYRNTKNGSTRVAEITDELVDVLRPRRVIGKALVFPSPNDPRRPADIRSAWETALRRAGIENFRFHDLRHTGASYAAMNGATSAELAALLGHKTLAMVARYAHHPDAYVAKASTRVAGFMDEALGNG
jgi:integrase